MPCMINTRLLFYCYCLFHVIVTCAKLVTTVTLPVHTIKSYSIVQTDLPAEVDWKVHGSLATRRERELAAHFPEHNRRHGKLQYNILVYITISILRRVCDNNIQFAGTPYTHARICVGPDIPATPHPWSGAPDLRSRKLARQPSRHHGRAEGGHGPRRNHFQLQPMLQGIGDGRVPDRTRKCIYPPPPRNVFYVIWTPSAENYVFPSSRSRPTCRVLSV